MRYAVAIFLGSFLLFQIQPIAARYILPWFGGGASVWTACMLFFQVCLLAGYAYAYLLTRYLAPRKQVIVHLLLLAGTLALLPITPAETWKPSGSGNPEWGIIVLLLFTIGGPFLLVSSTGPLLQNWFAGVRPGKSPYRLFALSNVASLLALVTYPFLIEPYFGLDVQTKTWSMGYILYVLAVGVCASQVFFEPAKPRSAEETAHSYEPGPDRARVVLWMALSACGVVVLLATTNEMAQNIFPVPFLWILPLSLYLVSFVISFESERGYVRRFWVTLFCIGFLPAVFYLHMGKVDDFVYQIILYSILLLAACMICHGELARLKPSPKYLTSFYLTIAFGGALGSVLVNLAAPQLFSRYWEYPLGLFGVYLLAGICRFREASHEASPAEKKINKKMRLQKAAFLKNRRRTQWLWGTGGVAFVFALGLSVYIFESNDLANDRNFYGRLHVNERVAESGDVVRSLMHGQIIHGEQIMDAKSRVVPTLYFRDKSGVAMAVRHYNHTPGLRMGVIGLGAGTIASYASAGDVVRFYEINPAVKEFAEKYFYYLQDCKGDCPVILGDARISLERELKESGGQDFHILVVDAFSSDSIPVHLMTEEAFSLYWQHLQPDGILAFHISNAYLDLSPVIRNLAQQFGKQAISVTVEPDRRSWSKAEWVLVTSNQQFMDSEKLKQHFKPWPDEKLRKVTWTDDYSNLFSALK